MGILLNRGTPTGAPLIFEVRTSQANALLSVLAAIRESDALAMIQRGRFTQAEWKHVQALRGSLRLTIDALARRQAARAPGLVPFRSSLEP